MGSCMYSSKVASAASGFGVGSCSTSKALEEAAAGGIASADSAFGVSNPGFCVSEESADVRDASEAGISGRADCAVKVADCAGGVLPDSELLRNNPRATRNVPFACSTLIGLVSTRLAPIRNALATPA